MFFIITCRIHLKNTLVCMMLVLCSKITHKVIYCIQSCCMQHINTLTMLLLSYVNIVVGAVWKYEPPPPKHHSCLSQTDSWWRNGKAGTHKSRLNCSIKACGMVYPILFAQGPNLTQNPMKNMTAIVCTFSYQYFIFIQREFQNDSNIQRIQDMIQYIRIRINVQTRFSFLLAFVLLNNFHCKNRLTNVIEILFDTVW